MNVGDLLVIFAASQRGEELIDPLLGQDHGRRMVSRARRIEESMADARITIDGDVVVGRRVASDLIDLRQREKPIAATLPMQDGCERSQVTALRRSSPAAVKSKARSRSHATSRSGPWSATTPLGFERQNTFGTSAQNPRRA